MPKIKPISGGANQSGLRDYNERLVLSMLVRNGPMPGVELARRAGVSAQTVSNILRKLESEGFVERGDPQRGKVGKPSIPMSHAAGGAFSFGLKVGRRVAELVLIDMKGCVRVQRHFPYTVAEPERVINFLVQNIHDIVASLKKHEQNRVCGLGIAAPFELWHKNKNTKAAQAEFYLWENVDLQQRALDAIRMPVYVMNDATAACRAEQVYGRGKEFRDYAYFFVASNLGGGIVLNHSVFEGHKGNAGALGSLPSTGPNGESVQLIDLASIHLLEDRLEQAGLRRDILWKQPQDWSSISRHVNAWMGQTAQELAKAALSACAVIDFDAVLIDGVFPENIRIELAERTSRYIANQDVRGLIAPTVEPGSIGCNARSIGAASAPIFAQFMLNTNVGLAEAR